VKGCRKLEDKDKMKITKIKKFQWAESELKRERERERERVSERERESWRERERELKREREVKKIDDEKAANISITSHPPSQAHTRT